MKQLKKILAICISVLLLTGSSVAAFAAAEDAPTLLFHYNFQGESDAVRLSNKAADGATGGLILTGSASSVSEDGYAYVNSAKGNYLSVSVGDDVKNLDGKATFSMVFKAEGVPTLMGDIGQIGKTVRVILGKDDKIILRAGENMTTSEATQKKVDSIVIPRGKWIHVAVTMETDGNGGLQETVYISVDGGVTYSNFSYSLSDVGGMFPAATEVLFGKVNKTIADRGTSFYYSDVRLYDGILTAAQIDEIPLPIDATTPDLPPVEDDSNLPARDISEFLVTHYDFMGDTEEEQLRDKASAGVSAEDLLLYATTDEENEKLSYIKNGIAHIDSAQSNFLLAIPGEDITKIEKDMTVFVAFRPSEGTSTTPCDFLAMDNTLRFAWHNRNYVFTRVGSGDLGSVGCDSAVVSRGQWYYAAIRMTYDPVTDTVFQKLFLSVDEGESYTEYTATTTSVASMFEDSTYLIIGKVKSTMADRGTDFDFKDIRIYNCAIRPSELPLIVVAEAEPSLPESDNIESTEKTDEPIPSDTQAPITETTHTPNTEPAQTDSDVTSEQQSDGVGCSAVVGIECVVFIGLLLVMGIVSMNFRKCGKCENGTN